MQLLKFHYSTHQYYSKDVFCHYYALRCIPRTEARQKIVSLSYNQWPEAESESLLDHYGNCLQKGRILIPHNEFGFSVSGIIQIDHSVLRNDWMPCYLYDSAYTQISSSIYEFYLLHKSDNQNALSRALILMNALYQYFSYKKGVTNVWTTAAEAMEIGNGVCQDYAHILISLCHLDHIPARYVAGFMIGEGMTHAWVEIMSEGSWYGLDVTNNLMVDESYIKLSHGRDYQDCAVIRGSFLGQVDQKQHIHVSVEIDK